ncbi:HNH endonuclease [Sinorhizobium meliloti]|uniref:HNH endonuclease domain-containing protein n=1 Tax=Rhizobium meliloti TaxID=382 RepID=UPI001294B4EE|nr:HNH endonuclease domain-containing protein [Sinorhizobium meliloti]MQV31032.1 HNH endonuclease [Sinorhizobium meliloti]
MTIGLPAQEGVDVDCLAQLFRNCTQSYKFLFFRGILATLHKNSRDHIRFDELLAEMIVASWWPAVVSRLSIGNAADNDTLTALLHTVGDSLHEKLSMREVHELARFWVRRERSRGSLRYVPEALLSPWKKDVQHPPLYRVRSDGIELYESWHSYLVANLPIVSGWADSAWLAWMQARNPNVPVSMEKLCPPSRRMGLALERKFFLKAMSAMPLECIYTQELVGEGDLSLDHFLPRSFVGHDRIWNLVPVAKSINSAKGARLPRSEYLDRLVLVHHRVINAVLPAAGSADRTFLDQYCTDLRVPRAQLSDERVLCDAYRGVVLPMMAIAKRMGFPAGWP